MATVRPSLRKALFVDLKVLGLASFAFAATDSWYSALRFVSSGPIFADVPLFAALSTASGDSGVGAGAATASDDAAPMATAAIRPAVNLRISFDITAVSYTHLTPAD